MPGARSGRRLEADARAFHSSLQGVPESRACASSGVPGASRHECSRDPGRSMAVSGCPMRATARTGEVGVRCVTLRVCLSRAATAIRNWCWARIQCVVVPVCTARRTAGMDANDEAGEIALDELVGGRGQMEPIELAAHRQWWDVQGARSGSNGSVTSSNRMARHSSGAHWSPDVSGKPGDKRTCLQRVHHWTP